MNKKIRLKFTAAFAEAMTQTFPDYARAQIKSHYLWPAEAVWQNQAPNITLYVVLSPEAKGQRDELTVELGWSRLNRFPELVQRPWLVRQESLVTANKLDEGSVRLGTLCNSEFDLLPVQEDTIEEVIAFLISKLQEKGIPFLKRVCHESP